MCLLNQKLILKMKFLTKIPEIEKKLELEDDEYTLEDHCKLYLLGLPNKLGPLGFLALHSILESVSIYGGGVEY